MALRSTIVDLTRDLATEVAGSLRRRDRIEVLASTPHGLTKAQALAWWVDHVLDGGESWAAVTVDGPVAMGGMRLIAGRPDLAGTWMVGTDRKLDAGPAIFHHALRMHREWTKRGVRRFQCTCLDSPDESSAWLGRLGYEREGFLRQFGLGGEDFIIWGKIHGS